MTLGILKKTLAFCPPKTGLVTPLISRVSKAVQVKKYLYYLAYTADDGSLIYVVETSSFKNCSSFIVPSYAIFAPYLLYSKVKSFFFKCIFFIENDQGFSFVLDLQDRLRPLYLFTTVCSHFLFAEILSYFFTLHKFIKTNFDIYLC